MGIEKIFSVLKISGAGLSAQRKWLEATASNIANVDTTETENGGPYIPRRVRFREIGFGEILRKVAGKAGQIPSAAVSGLNAAVEAEQVLQQRNPTQWVYEPQNPNANEEGYVEKPNINLVKEMSNMMLASRAYEANVSVMNAAKNMIKKAIEI